MPWAADYIDVDETRLSMLQGLSFQIWPSSLTLIHYLELPGHDWQVHNSVNAKSLAGSANLDDHETFPACRQRANEDYLCAGEACA